MSVQRVIVLLSVLTPFGLCANILGFFPIPSYSHQVVFQPIWKELSLRGHNVTVYTPSPLNDPKLTNLTEVDISALYKLFQSEEAKSVMYVERSFFEKFYFMYEYIYFPVERVLLQDPKVQELLKDNSSKYDLVIVEVYPPTFFALGYKFDCPFILTVSFDAFSPQHEFIGNPVHPLLYPDVLRKSIGDTSFMERVYNTLETLKMFMYYRFSVIPRAQENIKKHFGTGSPSLYDIERNASALFLNTNPMLHIPRPVVPNTIQMGYLHVKPRKELPTDLQQFLDGAVEGVILMSLGSNVKSAQLPKGIVEMFRDAFAELPYRVLWKWESGDVPNMPKNIYLKPWFPQQDILGHPNVKVFVMQGGLQSTEEAIFNNVPLVTLPFFSDQHYDSKRIEDIGIGRQLNPWTLTKNELKSTILEVIQNPKYRERVAEVQQVLQDQPMTSLERTIWWIEYIIRNKGAKYLRNPYLDMPFYQIYFLDVIGFLLVLGYLTYLPFKFLSKYQKAGYVCLVSFLLYYVMSW